LLILAIATAIYTFANRSITNEFVISEYSYTRGPAILNGKIIDVKDVENITLEEIQRDIHSSPEKYTKLSFMFAICAKYNKNEEILQAMIDVLEEPLKEQQKYLNSIFENAIRSSNNVEIIKKLVGLGAEIKGDILLDALQRNSNLDIARYLIEAGADVTVKDKDGNTALVYLLGTKIDAPDIVQMMIDKGVDVNAYKFKNPLEYSHVCGLKETEKLLVKAGAKAQDSFERLERIGMDCKRYSSYGYDSILH